MKVLFATPEFAPLVKTGGLGDVSAALPRALRALGHDVRVLMPAYGGMEPLRTDIGAWSPASDTLIAANHDHNTFARKAMNTRALHGRTGLMRTVEPLFGFVGRLATQKGIDWILDSAPAGWPPARSWWSSAGATPHWSTPCRTWRNPPGERARHTVL